MSIHHHLILSEGGFTMLDMIGAVRELDNINLKIDNVSEILQLPALM